MKRWIRSSALALCGAVLFGAGLSSAQASLFSDDTARQAIVDLKNQFSVLSRQQQTLDERLTRMESALQGYPDLVIRIDNLSQDLASLRGKVDSMGNQIDTVDKRTHDLYLDLDNRLKALESNVPKADGAASEGKPTQGLSPVAGKGTDQANSDPGATTASSKGDAVPNDVAPPSDYDAALAVFDKGNYAKSQKLFESFLTAHADDAKAPNALYWIGMDQLLLKNFKGAKSSNEALVKQYPDSSKAPDALLNLASAQAALGQGSAAHTTLKHLISQYPDSSAAAKARKRLHDH